MCQYIYERIKIDVKNSLILNLTHHFIVLRLTALLSENIICEKSKLWKPYFFQKFLYTLKKMMLIMNCCNYLF